MPRGRPRKIVLMEEEPELVGHKAAQYTIAEVLVPYCGITGCIPKHHMEDAGIILQKLIRLDLLKDDK